MEIDQLVEDLQRLGVREGGSLLVHASLRSLGEFPQRAQQVLAALKSALGASGTLLMPALSYKTVTQEQPIFDLNATPSCVGALSEYFRTNGDALRSMHPTHSVCAWGADAAWFVEDHLQDRTPVGPHSPFSKLREAGGYLLFLGCGLRPNTSMHGVEEEVIPPYLFGSEREYSLIFSDGTVQEKRYLPHDFSGYEQRYDRLAHLLDEGELRFGKVLRADSYLLSAKAVWEKGLEALKRDRLYFVDKITVH
ncbi:MAG: AAC(3) family N-acetyltransferase [Lunatimonas sp.]|uniref:AAC(3) family N-acetyltransferase n=1 Tax=Lunatimonas sp. TaxID=2060141 RepID=UPI00263A5A51|nr:AAC(3) family N-acetyltransferase [Lunatimonas sp.]MCC5935933.1 AAC(3) family N-acetyltransferase [Lunatimonas sp.]